MEREIQIQSGLRKLSTSDGPLVYRLLQRIPMMENGFYNGAHGLSYDQFKEWLVRQEEIAQGINLEPNTVAQTTYWLIENHIPIGYGKVRHELNEFYRQTGGNISYSIEPRKRGKGYGKKLLAGLLQEAKRQGQREVIITAYSYNKASIGVARANGGINYRILNKKHYFQFLIH